MYVKSLNYGRSRRHLIWRSLRPGSTTRRQAISLGENCFDVGWHGTTTTRKLIMEPLRTTTISTAISTASPRKPMGKQASTEILTCTPISKVQKPLTTPLRDCVLIPCMKTAWHITTTVSSLDIVTECITRLIRSINIHPTITLYKPLPLALLAILKWQKRQHGRQLDGSLVSNPKSHVFLQLAPGGSTHSETQGRPRWSTHRDAISCVNRRLFR